MINPTKAKVTSSFPHSGTLYAIALDSERNRLFAGSDDYGVHVFDPDAKDKKAIARWDKHESYLSALVWRGGPRPGLISAGFDRQIVWWDAEGKTTRSVEGHDGWVRDLALTPDGNQLVSVGDDMLVKVWDADSGKLIRSLEGHARQTPQGHVTALYEVAISPDGKFLASGDRVGEVRVWELASGKLLQTLQVPTVYTYDERQRKRSLGGIRALSFSLDGKLLAVGGMGQVGNVDGLGGVVHVELWDWQTPSQRLVTGIKDHKGYVNDFIFHPSSPWLLAGGTSCYAFWQIDSLPDKVDPKVKDPVPNHLIKNDGHVHGIVLAPSGDTLYAAGYRKLEVVTLK